MLVSFNIERIHEIGANENLLGKSVASATYYGISGMVTNLSLILLLVIVHGHNYYQLKVQNMCVTKT